MYQLSEKLLAVFLTLLLGFSPLQGAMVSVASSFDQGEGTHQMAGMHAGMAMASDHALGHDCEQCNTDDCCASCVLALPAIYSYHSNLTATPVLIRADNGFVNPLSASPFRPPKA